MKTIRLLLTLPLFLGLSAILFQGCYTQFATIKEDESSYEQEEQNFSQSDSAAYDNANYNYDDNWQSHNYIGFSYYYPGWRSYWAWDYGCVYPTYWDPLLLGPAFYTGYAYYPHHWGYWDSYPRYGYDHSYQSRSFVTRNSGFQRGGNIRRVGGTVRSTTSGSTGTGRIYNTQGTSTRGGSVLPNATSTGTRQSGTSTARVRSNRIGTVTPIHSSGRVSTGRSSRGNSKSSVSTPRTRSSRGASVQRVESTRSSAPTPAPSYTPPPQQTSPPPSAPAPRNDGGEQRSRGSSRVRR